VFSLFYFLKNYARFPLAVIHGKSLDSLGGLSYISPPLFFVNLRNEHS
jgi:hypothetical protein